MTAAAAAAAAAATGGPKVARLRSRPWFAICRRAVQIVATVSRASTVGTRHDSVAAAPGPTVSGSCRDLARAGTVTATPAQVFFSQRHQWPKTSA